MAGYFADEHDRNAFLLFAALSVPAFLAADHFAQLACTAKTADAASAIAFASQRLGDSFIPWSGFFFAVGLHPYALGLGAVAAIALFWAYLSLKAKGIFRRGEEHGSARWAKASELAHYADADIPMNNMLLSRDVRIRAGGPCAYADKVPNRNILVFGGSGSGKTYGFIKPNLMQVAHEANGGGTVGMGDMERCARSFFVTDSKGMTVAETGHLFAECPGTRIKMFNVIDWEASSRFNPFHYITDLSMTMSFATCLINNTSGSDDPNREDFWEKSEKEFFDFLGKLLLLEVPPEDRNLATLCRFLDMAECRDDGSMSPLDVFMHEIEYGVRYVPPSQASPAPSTAEDAWDLACARMAAGPVQWELAGTPQPNHPAVLAYNDFKSGARETKQSILISCKVRLAPIRNDAVMDALSSDEMELDKLGDRRQVIYAVFNDQDSTYNFLIALMVWILLKQLYLRCQLKYSDTGALPVGVDLLLDEFANLYIPDMDSIISTCRSRNIGISVILQSYAQLEERYGKKANSIVDNCASLVFLGGKSTDTNEMLTKMIGQQTVTTDNASESKGRHGSVSRTTAQHARDLIQSAEISRLDPMECLVLIQGNHAYLGPKIDPAALPLWPWVDPGREGARFSRAFDFAAYRANRRYYRADAELSCVPCFSVSRYVPFLEARAVPAISVRVRVLVENSSDATAFDVRADLTLAAVCLDNEEAEEAGLPAPIPRLAHRTGADGRPAALANAGWVPRESSAALLSDPASAGTSAVRFLDTLREYRISGISIPPHDSFVVNVSMEMGEGLIVSALADAGRESARFLFAFEAYASCANADLRIPPAHLELRVFADGTFEVCER